MRDLLLNICPAAIWLIIICESIIAVLLLRQWKKNKKTLALLTFFVSAGLILDAVIIGLGSVIQQEVLRTISPARFIAHGVLIPLLFPICGYALDLKKPVMRAIWILTALLMAAGAGQAENAVSVPVRLPDVRLFSARTSDRQYRPDLFYQHVWRIVYGAVFVFVCKETVISR